MDVRDHRQAHFVFHPGQDVKARFQTGTAVRGQGGAVGFIKGGLEDQGQVELGGIVFQAAGDGQGKLGGLDDARPGDHHQVAFTYPKVGDCDGIIHNEFSYGSPPLHAGWVGGVGGGQGAKSLALPPTFFSP